MVSCRHRWRNDGMVKYRYADTYPKRYSAGRVIFATLPPADREKLCSVNTTERFELLLHAVGQALDAGV